MQPAESRHTGTREGAAFQADGFIPSKLLFALSGWENKGKYKDTQDGSRTIGVICMNTIVISTRVRESARRRCKEKWYNRQTVQMGRTLSSLRSTMDKGLCS